LDKEDEQILPETGNNRVDEDGNASVGSGSAGTVGSADKGKGKKVIRKK